MHKIYIYYIYHLHFIWHIIIWARCHFWRNDVSCKLQTKFRLQWIENQHYITTVHHSLFGSFRDISFTLTDKDGIVTLYTFCKKKKTNNACLHHTVYMQYIRNDLWWFTQIMKTGIPSDYFCVMNGSLQEPVIKLTLSQIKALPLSHIHFDSNFDINLLTTKQNLLYIRNQSVPHSKHFLSRL